MNVTVTQILRPVKLAFLIQPGKPSSYVRALQVSSSLWGGKHFPIIPIYKKFTADYREQYHLANDSPKEFYNNILDNFNPDYLVVDEGVDENFVRSLTNNRELVSIAVLEESIAADESQYGISIQEILLTIKENDFAYHRTDGQTVCCPRVRARDLFTMTLCGNIASEVFERIQLLDFPADYISFPRITPKNFNRCIGDNIWSYLSLTTYKADAYGSPFWTSEFAIFIIDPHHLNDLINIWNYRALGWHILAIPIDSLNDPYYEDQIKKHQNAFRADRRLTDRINVIANYKMDSDSVFSCIDQISAIQTDIQQPVNYSHHWWLPRFWEKGRYLSSDRAAAIRLQSARQTAIITTEDLKIQVPVLRPVFRQKYVRHISPRYVNEILLTFDETEGKYAQILPELPTRQLDYLIRGSGFSQWIFSEGVAHYLAQEKDEYLSLYIAKASEVFKEWFAIQGIQIRHSSSGKLGNELLRNIGGVFGTNFLANPGIVPVLAHFENGRIVSKETLYAELNRQIQQQKFRDTQQKDITAKLLNYSMIEFGAQVQCTFCNQHSFYKLKDVNDILKCPVCQNAFSIPAHFPNDIKWSYRGMGPFSRNNKADGLLCVLLTMRFFKISMRISRITPLLSFELLKDNNVINEVDLGVFFSKEYRSFEKPDLFLVECKTEIDFKDSDVEKMKKLGQLFPGAVLTFATLKPALSDDEKLRIGRLVNYFRKGLGPRPINPVLILTGNELLPLNTFAPLAKLEPRIIAHLNFSDEINHLADISCQEYLDLPSFGSVVEEKLEIRRAGRNKNKASR